MGVTLAGVTEQSRASGSLTCGTDDIGIIGHYIPGVQDTLSALEVSRSALSDNGFLRIGCSGGFIGSHLGDGSWEASGTWHSRAQPHEEVEVPQSKAI